VPCALNSYLQEQQQINNNNANVNNNADPGCAQHHYQDNLVRIIASIDAEMTLYVSEPSLPLQDNQQNFSCPLTWWKLNQSKYKMLSEVALHILCIPATSAPSERVNELIFLHDALPAIRKYEESCACN
jgi:hypothetical protein